jgi:hypothetical protein
VQGAAAAVVVPGASAEVSVSGTTRENIVPQRVRATAAPGGLRSESVASSAAENVAKGAIVHRETAATASVEAAPTASKQETTPASLAEARAAGVTEESVAVKQSRSETTRAQALSQVSNVRVEKTVAQLSPDLAWNVNQSQSLALRMRTEELRQSGSVAEQRAQMSTQAILSRREVLASSTAQQPAESVVRQAAGEERATARSAEEVSNATTRVEVAAGNTLVHVVARNTSQEVVERPVLEIALPAGVRYESIASAPPNTAVRVLRSGKQEKVEMVLPFALFQQEAAQVAVQTSPLPTTAAGELRAKVRPMETGTRASSETPRQELVPQETETTTTREHLHPRH